MGHNHIGFLHKKGEKKTTEIGLRKGERSREEGFLEGENYNGTCLLHINMVTPPYVTYILLLACVLLYFHSFKLGCTLVLLSTLVSLSLIFSFPFFRVSNKSHLKKIPHILFNLRYKKEISSLRNVVWSIRVTFYILCNVW